MANEEESATEEKETIDMRMRTRKIEAKRIKKKTGETIIKDLVRDHGADLDLDPMVSEEKREVKVVMTTDIEIMIRIKREIDMTVAM